MRNKTIFLAVLSLAVWLPLAAVAAMSGPDAGVNQSWRPNEAQAQSSNNNSGGNSGNPNAFRNMNLGGNALPMSGAYEGTIEFKGTITAVNTTDRSFAVNGRWVNPQRWMDLARMMNFQVTGVDASTMRAVWNDLAVGDRVHVKAHISASGVHVSNWNVHKAVNDQARAELQARLNALIQQVNQLMLQLRNLGVLPNTTTTPTSTTSTTP